MDLDRLYLPHWQFSEHHQRLIDAPAAALLDAVEDLLRFDDPLSGERRTFESGLRLDWQV